MFFDSDKEMDHFTYVFLVFISGITLAYDNLSYNKRATQSSTYYGLYMDYVANKAVDGDITTCTRTNVIGAGTGYPDNTVWWKVDLGGVYSIYNISILFKTYGGYESRQRGRFAGFSLYISNTDVSSRADIQKSTLCNKNGPQLPPLNFTTTCIEYGRYVIFYNERLNGVSYPTGYKVDNVYTELCEVSIAGCIRHEVYGNQCNIACPMSCKNKVCNIVNGNCHTCETGWTGDICTIKCAVGRYGVKCEGICSGHCDDNNTCNHVTGQCDEGCAAGWNGSLCDKACFQSYGKNCHYPCNQHCYNRDCDRYNGSCLTGCTDGFYGERCAKDIQLLRKDTPSSINWIVGLSIALAVNIILIISICAIRRGKYETKGFIFGNVLSCWKKSDFYQETNATVDEPSTYQELNVPVPITELPYHNTTLK